jgi:hypothetical protein
MYSIMVYLIYITSSFLPFTHTHIYIYIYTLKCTWVHFVCRIHRPASLHLPSAPTVRPCLPVHPLAQPNCISAHL